MTSIDNLAEEIMQGLQEYADLADTAMKKAVRKTATQVKNEISANAPKDTGKYAKSWATKKTGENSHSLEMTVHSKNRYQLAHLLEKGHAKRGGGRVSGKPHIAPAEENGVQLLEHLIEGGFVMTYEQIAEMMEEMGLPFAYHHFAEGESPAPPFLIFLSPGENTFSADNSMYFSFKMLDIELYTDVKNPELENQIEEVLKRHEIYYTKSEVWIESERLYEVLYETEV